MNPAEEYPGTDFCCRMLDHSELPAGLVNGMNRIYNKKPFIESSPGTLQIK